MSGGKGNMRDLTVGQRVRVTRGIVSDIEFELSVSTYGIDTGRCDFRTYALRCAKALGWEVRADGPFGETAPAPVSWSGDAEHLEKQIIESTVELARLEAMTLADAEAECDRQYEEDRARHFQREHDAILKKAPYNVMLTQALEWRPPTKEHEKIKDAMVAMLRKEIASIERMADWGQPKRKDAGVWLAEQIAYAKRNIAENPAMIQERRKELAERETRVQVLYDSLSDAR